MHQSTAVRLASATILAALTFAVSTPAQTAWLQLMPANSPSARTKGQLTFVLSSGNVLMFGGIDNAQTYLNETWTWDGVTWTQENPTGIPTGRIQSDLVYDLVRDRVVMWSGYPGGNGYVQDLWEWVPNGGAPGASGDWVPVQQAPGAIWPQERDHMAMVYDLPRGRTLMFGGWNYFVGQVLYNDMWSWDGTAWTQILPNNPAPPARDGHDMVIDPVRGQIVMFGGGRAFSAPMGDTWTYDLNANTWTQQMPANSPSARYNHTMVYDEARQRVVLFGGRTQLQTFNDVWEWDGTDWQQRMPANAPSQRQYGKMAYDSFREHLVMFGGDLSSAFGGGNNETWIYAPITPASWTSFGNGCPGANAGSPVPSLSGGARPWVGDTAELSLTSLPNPTLAFLVAGLSNTSSPLGPLPLNLAPFGLTQNCNLLVSPLVTVTQAGNAGAALFQIPLGNSPALVGLHIYLQGAATEAPSNIVISNAVEGVLGGR